MKKEQMVGTRLPETIVRDLETIEEAEQSDRSIGAKQDVVHVQRETAYAPIQACQGRLRSTPKATTRMASTQGQRAL